MQGAVKDESCLHCSLLSLSTCLNHELSPSSHPPMSAADTACPHTESVNQSVLLYQVVLASCVSVSVRKSVKIVQADLLSQTFSNLLSFNAMNIYYFQILGILGFRQWI